MNNEKYLIPGLGYLINAVVVTTMLFAFAAETYAQQGGTVRKIVMFKKNFKNVNAQKSLLQALGSGEEGLPLELINGMAVTLPAGVINALTDAEEVLLVEDDIRIHAAGKPDWAGGNKHDPALSSSQVLPWGVDRIDAEWAWPFKGIGVKVAVLDSGIDRKHPDLTVAGGINFVPPSPLRKVQPGKWQDDFGHGTHVAGIIGALDNGFGVVGVAPDVSLYAVKILDQNGAGYQSDLIAGLAWAVENKMHLVNMSLGTTQSAALEDACNAASAAGLILVAAAGNERLDGNTVAYPAAFDSVIAVAATKEDDDIYPTSSQGETIAIAGPGAYIISTYADRAYMRMTGTSMAAPHVTGALALKISDDLQTSGMKDLAYYQDLLCSTADNIGLSAIDAGCGLVDAEELVTGNESGNNLQ